MCPSLREVSHSRALGQVSASSRPPRRARARCLRPTQVPVPSPGQHRTDSMRGPPSRPWAQGRASALARFPFPRTSPKKERISQNIFWLGCQGGQEAFLPRDSTRWFKPRHSSCESQRTPGNDFWKISCGVCGGGGGLAFTPPDRAVFAGIAPPTPSPRKMAWNHAGPTPVRAKSCGARPAVSGSGFAFLRSS